MAWPQQWKRRPPARPRARSRWRGARTCRRRPCRRRHAPTATCCGPRGRCGPSAPVLVPLPLQTTISLQCRRPPRRHQRRQRSRRRLRSSSSSSSSSVPPETVGERAVATARVTIAWYCWSHACAPHCAMCARAADMPSHHSHTRSLQHHSHQDPSIAIRVACAATQRHVCRELFSARARFCAVPGPVPVLTPCVPPLTCRR